MANSESNQSIVKWLQNRMTQWQRMEGLLARQRGRKDEVSDEVLELAQGYRSLARDVSLARNNMPDSRVTRYLENMLLQAYDLIHRNPHSLRGQLGRLFRIEVPRAMQELHKPIFFSTLIFVISAVLGWILVNAYPELATLFASEEMISMVQQGRLWTDDLHNVVPSSLLSFRIMTNNIAVTLFAFVLGSFYGLGTLYILGLNGLMLGGIFAFTGHYQMDERLLQFVVAHGMVELSIIVLAGAAGIKLGEALIRPGHMTRIEAFQQAVTRASKLVAVGAPLLVGAGLIEGYISPNPDIGMQTRLIVGFAYWVFMVLVLTGRIWPKQAQAQAA